MADFKLLTPEEIDEADDVIVEPHPTPEWGKGRGVYVRSISAADRGMVEAEAAVFKETKGKNATFVRDFTTMMAWLGMCNEKGERLYGKRSDVERLKKKNADVVGRISEHVQRLSGLEKKDIEALEKNSEEAQPDDSLSD